MHPGPSGPGEGCSRYSSPGATREEILEEYPYLEAEDITAVLEFAARQND